MNLVLVLVSLFLALGAAVNGGSPQPTQAVTAAAADTVTVAAPTLAPAAAPAPYDIISGGGPTH